MAEHRIPVVGLYTRISDDAEGLGLGVGRQEEDGTKLAERRGWTIGKVYEDNDLSAFKKNVTRPAFREMLDDLKNGRLDGIIVYNLDRLARQPRDLEDVIDLYDAQPGALFATVDASYDLATSDGRTMARVLVTFANKASEDTSRRVKRKKLADAQEGKPHPGRFRCYGYSADGLELVEEEAVVLQELAGRVLAGETLRSLAADLNARGIKTTSDGTWRPQTVRRLMLNPRMIAKRIYEGVTYDGNWPPVLDARTFAQVGTILESAERSAHLTNAPTVRKHLLPGYIICGNCGSYMAAGNRRVKGHKMPAYRCMKCQKLSVAQGQADEFARDLVLRELGVLKHAHLDRDVAGSAGNVAELSEKLAELEDAYYVAGTLTKPAYERMSGQLKNKLSEARRTLSEATLGNVLDGVPVGDPEALAALWETADLDTKRAMMAPVLKRLVVQPAKTTGRGSKFADRVTVELVERTMRPTPSGTWRIDK